MKLAITVALAFLADASAQFVTYHAAIAPLGESNVTGYAVVFSGGSDSPGIAGYAGKGSGLEANLMASSCDATNGCGAHIHDGFSCDNSTLQGGHIFADSISVDPWIDERYSSDENGDASFAGIVSIGIDDLEGRAFLIHDESGARVGCGLLEQVPPNLYVGESGLVGIGDSAVSGSVTTYQPEAEGDTICFFGEASGLESNLTSFLAGGTDCTNTNGCGAHIHSGSACNNSTAQGGHFYNSSIVEEDPWKFAGYLSSDGSGNGYFIDCLQTGETDFVNRPFVVHANDGSRVSCGLLQETNACGRTILGPGKVMSRPRTIANFLFGLLNVDGLSDTCRTVCVPDLWVSLYSRFGYSVGDC